MTDWFARRTYQAADFTVDDLIRRKEDQDVTVSVVLPARNEAETIAGMVAVCAELAGTLVDELVVMDGDSEDGTAELAAAAGARVHSDNEVLPEFGRALGKGDALWRSLEVTSGDVVVFVDGDVRNPDARFVWGLLGPLLMDQGVHFSKGFYDRPMRLGRVLHKTGGGRVTELAARPLLNLFWPELATLVQPLSGEYAARRPLLDRLPFFTGYGVELGLLIDTAALEGIDAIAQVDLRERVHRNQSLDALSRMAFAIQHVAMRRLDERDGTALARELPTSYVQFERGEEGRIAAVEHAVEIIERPPRASLGR